MKFSTSAPLRDGLLSVAVPQRVAIPVDCQHKVVVKKKQVVGKGQVIAESGKGPFGLGYVHASIDGIVEDITPSTVVIGPLPVPEEGKTAPSVDHPAPRQDHKNLGGEELVRWLREMGIDTGKFHPTRALVVNGLNPEPGVTVSEQLLHSERQVMDAGINVLERAMRPGNVYLVVARGKGLGLHGAHVVEVNPIYPATLDPLAVKAALGSENPEAVDVISASDVYRVGRVVTTGLPLTEAVVSAGEAVWRVPTGIPVGEVLAAAQMSVPSGATVVLGGPMRGDAISSLETGVPENCTAITVIPPGIYPQVAPNPCINCGECVLVCPARIQPGMLSRYAEFALFDETRPRAIAACLDCGLCTYVCPANRPVLQYIRLAKRKLEERDAQLAVCRLSDE